MATPTFDLQWWHPTTPTDGGVVGKLLLVRNETVYNRTIAKIRHIDSVYKVGFYFAGGDFVDVVPFEFASLDDAKAYARVTCLLTLKVTLKGKS